MKDTIEESSEFKAVILAAGLGSRINEITKDIPKSMIKIDGEYIFEMMINSLIEVGIKNIIIVIGYKHELLKSEINKVFESENINITFVYNIDYDKTNT